MLPHAPPTLLHLHDLLVVDVQHLPLAQNIHRTFVRIHKYRYPHAPPTLLHLHDLVVDVQHLPPAQNIHHTFVRIPVGTGTMSGSNKRPCPDNGDEKEYVLFQTDDADTPSGLIEIHDLPKEVLLLVINTLFISTGNPSKIELYMGSMSIEDLFEKEDLAFIQFFKYHNKLDIYGNVDHIKKMIDASKKSKEFGSFIKKKMEEEELNDKEDVIDIITEEIQDEINEALTDFASDPKVKPVPFPSTIKLVGHIVASCM